MSRCLFRTFAVVLALALAAAMPAAAQNVSGSVAGTVVDQQGQVVPGATVTITNESTGDARVTVTDARGDFQGVNLQPATYTVRVEMQGFRTIERKGNVLTAAERLSLGTLTLAVGSLGETVVVEAAGTHVNVGESQHSGLITATQIEQISVKGRDVTSMMRLLPGVRYEDTVDSLGESFGTLVPHVGGQRRDWNAIMVDGVLGNEIGQANRMAQQINLDAVAEIKVLLNTYRAEYGRTGGAQVQIVSKAGSSRYAGGTYYYGRHERLNANNFFNNSARLPKAKYRFNTYGFNLGGPLERRSKDDKKLFFFYSLEAPLTQRPGPVRRFTLPTALERQGDFSQTVDSAGRQIVIKDPLTGQPFANNIVPANRINKSGQALLNLMPLPNSTDPARQFNYQTQTTAENPKMNNVARVDWRPSPRDTFYFTFKDWYSDQRGSEVTAGPAKWNWFNTHYLNTDRGGSANYDKILRPNVVNEAAYGIRYQTEQFHPVDESDWKRIRRSDVGYSLGQFHPELNPEGVVPKATFGVPSSPDLTFDNRLGQKGSAWLNSFRDNLTWLKGTHSYKTGVYVEWLANTEGKGGVGAGPWAGQFAFNVDTNNPFDTGFGFSNALLGSFRDYTEIDAYPEVRAKRFLSEWYAQDTWKAGRRVTLDYGLRFLYYNPWYTSLPAAVFVPDRYDPKRAPRLYAPTRVNNVNLAIDPVTGQTLPNIFVGVFVPGSGDPYNGMVKNTDPNYPKGFRDNQGVHLEPRLGLAWDIFGDGSTALHTSGGIYHNAHITARSMDSAANNPPAVNTPSIIYGTMDTLLQQAAFSSRPSNVFGLERDAKTPTSYNWSVGIQREIGWGTVVDATYAGSATRHLEVVENINVVADGARFLDLNPQNRDPRNTANPLPSEFLRPYTGYQNITMRYNFGTSDYHALQLQVNRRYIRGLQFSVAYTFGRTKGIVDEDEGTISAVRPLHAWNYAPYSSSQRHALVINYTWDLPKGSRHLWNSALTRGILDNWQLSGENAFVSGDWSPVNLATTDNFDFTGGDGGNGGDVGGGVRVVRPVIVGAPIAADRNPYPGQPGSWLNVAAFQRPAGRGDFGNAPRTLFQLPGIDNWNLAIFKNVPAGSTRRLQLRWEVYNLLNHTQFSSIDTTARFDATGAQVNAAFGKATGARNPRIMQGSIRFSF